MTVVDRLPAVRPLPGLQGDGSGDVAGVGHFCAGEAHSHPPPISGAGEDESEGGQCPQLTVCCLLRHSAGGAEASGLQRVLESPVPRHLASVVCFSDIPYQSLEPSRIDWQSNLGCAVTSGETDRLVLGEANMIPQDGVVGGGKQSVHHSTDSTREKWEGEKWKLVF